MAEIAWGRGIEGWILRVRCADGRTIGSAAFKGIVVPEAERRRIARFLAAHRSGTPTTRHAAQSARPVFGPAEVLCLGGFLTCLIVAVTL